MNEATATALGVLVRHGMTIAGGATAGVGMASGETVNAAVGGLVTLAGLAMSFWEKRERLRAELNRDHKAEAPCPPAAPPTKPARKSTPRKRLK